MKAISPVIATVIIVAVAIALAIAVALWITGVIGGLSRMERLDITAAYYDSTLYCNISNGDLYNCSTTVPAKPYDYTGYKIIIELSNKGTIDVTIDKVFVNNIPANLTTNEIYRVEDANGNGLIEAGENARIYLYLSQSKYTSGQVVQVIVHTATGGEYPAQVTLP